jgi:predicted transcriptional regulator of viral defense system
LHGFCDSGRYYFGIKYDKKSKKQHLSFLFVYNNIITNKKDKGRMMVSKELVLKLLEKNNGVLKASQATQAGIDNKVLQRMNNAGEIERVAHGLYIDPNYMEDSYLIAQYRCKKGIFSHETALFLHDLIDRTPLQLTLTVPSGSNTRLLRERQNYQFFYNNKEIYELGKMAMVSPAGNQIYVYNKERTICDCVKKKQQMDVDLVNSAIKQYMKELGANFDQLLEYAEILNVRETIRQYMEVLA